VTSYPKRARKNSPEAIENARLARRRHERNRYKRRASEKSLRFAKPTPALFRIYLLLNLKTGMKYVGRTKESLAERWGRHVEKSTKRDYALPRAIRTFGEAAFAVSVLNEATNETVADQLERFWIRELRTLHPLGYNEQEGGSKGFTWSEKSRAKMRTSIKKTNERKKAA
jgi:hypothetical protein